MRLLGKVAIGGGLASAATVTGLLVTGVLATSATIVALDPAAPRAEAKALAPFDSCDALLDWYVANTVKDVGPYGLEGWYGYGGDLVLRQGFALAVPGATVPTAADSVTADQVRSSKTGTNTQEASVDEPDVAKTNGTLIARIEDDEELVLLDVTGTRPRETARLRLPAYGTGSELLLAGDHVLVTQQVYRGLEDSVAKDSSLPYRPGRSVTRVVDVDIADPANPRLLSRDRYTGRLLSARLYDGTVRLVTAAEPPVLDWTYPDKRVSSREATRRNRDLVRRTTIEDWLPQVARNGAPGPLVDCEDVLHPEKFAGNETVVVTTFPAGEADQRTATAVTATGGIVYSSTDRLYLATTEYRSRVASLLRRDAEPRRPSTGVHAFDLTGTETRYVGSGEVDGTVRDRWSLDEQDGRLRVAWSQTGSRGRTSNGITVMTERDGSLVPTATVGDLGIDEDIQSVRWFDDLAVVVTFRQVDPLYTIDLSDPDDPELLGALKIPGYSGYLHPIGDDLLLGLGMSGDEDGLTGGAQAAVFDISNPRKAVRLSQSSLPRDTYFQALDDPRGFTWTPGTGITPLSDWSRGTARMLAIDVTPAGKLSTRTLAPLNAEWQARSFALPDGRIAVLDDHRVRLLRL